MKGKIFLMALLALGLLGACGRGKPKESSIEQTESQTGTSASETTKKEPQAKEPEHIQARLVRTLLTEDPDKQYKEELLLEQEDYPKLAEALKAVNGAVMDEGDSLLLERADSIAFSMLLTRFVGAQNGDLLEYEVESFSIDPQTGEEIPIEEVVDLSKDPAKVLGDDDSLFEEYGDDIPDFYEYLHEIFKGTKSKAHAWTLTNAGLCLYMAADTSPTPKVRSLLISFDQYPDLFLPKYVKTAKNAGFKLYPGVEAAIDLDGDKKPEKVQISNGSEGENGYVEEYLLKVDDQVYTYPDGSSYGIANAYVLPFGGENYLYLDLSYDNDYRSVSVVNLNEPQENLVGIDNMLSDTPPLNPEKFYLMDRTDTVGTMHVERLYGMETNGMPRPLSSSYEIVKGDLQVMLTTKLALTFQEVQNGQLGQEVEVPAGTRMLPVATDKESYTDFLTEDGKTLRLPMERMSEGYGFEVQGKPVQDCFDGMIFAG